jgi:subtilisin-like proprotein convertase family protein
VLRFDNSTPAFIPDLGETNSIVLVSNITAALSKVTVSLFITHTYDSDLLLQLISPDGTTNTLSASNGGSGQNYGLSCSPDAMRTTFDDGASNSISGAFAPFVGTFQPETPLAVFIGKSGTNINGAWRLRAVDQALFDVGTLQCWSLFLTPAACLDGGGECPGADMARHRWRHVDLQYLGHEQWPQQCQGRAGYPSAPQRGRFRKRGFFSGSLRPVGRSGHVQPRRYGPRRLGHNHGPGHAAEYGDRFLDRPGQF